MKVLHVPFSFHPDPVGGTEVYVDMLARQQQAEGLAVVVAAPGECEASYDHEGLRVRRFPVPQTVTDIRELYGEGSQMAAERFAAILDDERPDLVHLHAFTRGASILLVRAAKRRAVPVVFSYHTPTVSCQRGTLMRWGSEVCQGKLDEKVCTACTLHGLGLNRALSGAIGSLPFGVSRVADLTGLSGGIWTALRMRGLVQGRHTAFRGLVTEVDAVVALCEWVREILVRNGVPSSKVTVSRQGLSHTRVSAAERSSSSTAARDVLRVVFFGRLDPTKGIQVLVEAIKSAPAMRVELDVFGIVHGDDGLKHLRMLQQLAATDDRIRFKDSVHTEEVVSRMRDYDVVAVPSQWLETGPMVVMEAFAAGVPVLGSNLGGIAELVTHNVNGLLVEPQSTNAWRSALSRLCIDCNLLRRLGAGIERPRTINDVSLEMTRLYASLLGGDGLSADHPSRQRVQIRRPRPMMARRA